MRRERENKLPSSRGFDWYLRASRPAMMAANFIYASSKQHILAPIHFLLDSVSTVRRRSEINRLSNDRWWPYTGSSFIAGDAV